MKFRRRRVRTVPSRRRQAIHDRRLNRSQDRDPCRGSAFCRYQTVEQAVCGRPRRGNIGHGRRWTPARRRRAHVITAIAFDRDKAEAVRDWRSRLEKLKSSSLLTSILRKPLTPPNCGRHWPSLRKA